MLIKYRRETRKTIRKETDEKERLDIPEFSPGKRNRGMTKLQCNFHNLEL